MLDGYAWITILALAGAGLLWSWGTWPDVLIDFGRELYVPWRLSEGAVLYRDIGYFHGPLSPYLNTLFFLIFGVSLRTLVFANFAIMLGALLLLYLIFKKLAGRSTATLVCVSFLVLFAFSQLVRYGNYNWICPYSHEVTHASALSLLSIFLLYRYSETGWISLIAGSGLCLGLVFLTKVEFVCAAAMATGVGLMLILGQRGTRWEERISRGGVWLGCALIAPSVAFAALATVLPPNRAAVGMIGDWAHVFDRTVTTNPFYRWRMGTDDLPARLTHIAYAVFWYVLSIAGGLGIAIGFRRDTNLARCLAGLLIAGFAGVLWTIRSWVPWFDLAAPWQIFLLAMAAWTVWEFRHATRDSRLRSRLVLQAMLVAFSFGLLLRMLFHVEIRQYGFTLAMPATLLAIVAGYAWIPHLVSKFGGLAYVFRGLFLVFLLFVLTAHLLLSETYFRQKTYPVGTGADRFYADSRGLFLARAIEVLGENVHGRSTLAAFPEGIMLNYLIRVPNPTPYVLYIPMDMLLLGEQNMLKSLQKHPPEWVVLIHRDDSEYGPRYFGQDYGRPIMRWLHESYDSYELIGHMPFQSNQFGMLIARHKLQPEGGRAGR